MKKIKMSLPHLFGLSSSFQASLEYPRKQGAKDTYDINNTYLLIFQEIYKSIFNENQNAQMYCESMTQCNVWHKP